MCQLILSLPAVSSYADVVEASTGNPDVSIQNYDFSGLTVEERQWFLKFVEGTFYADGWDEIANDILVKLSGDERQEKQEKLNELGNKIGREWCKNNDIRKIDTDMLRKWGSMLRSTAQDDPHLIAEVIDDIDGEVNSLID